MKIGFTLPSNWNLPDPTTLVDMLVLAEEVGFNAVWLGEQTLLRAPAPAGLHRRAHLAHPARHLREDPVEMGPLPPRWADHGANEVLLRLNVPDVDRLRSEITRIGREVLPFVAGGAVWRHKACRNEPRPLPTR